MSSWQRASRRRASVLVSASWTITDELAQAFEEEGPHVAVLRRASDWERGRVGKTAALVRSSLRAVLLARGRRALVLVTAGHEVYLASLLCALLPRSQRPRLVVADFLMPRSRRFAGVQSWLLRRVDAWACIRSGDPANLARLFDVDQDRCAWVPFPSALSTHQASVRDPDLVDEPFVYSAGNAHRDWATVVEALRAVGCPATLSLDLDHPQLRGVEIPPLVTLLPPVSPEDGRALAARAVLVVVALQETHLPAGPLVLVDALAMGKAVVATDVNGTRDYVDDGRTALVVPAHDPLALADAIRRLLDDPALRASLGARAREKVSVDFRPRRFASEVLALASSELVAHASGRPT